MTQEDFDLIIFESFDHLHALPDYFEGKRELFECTRGDYTSGLIRAYEGLIREVNLTNYERTVYVLSNGESVEENLNDIEQVEFLKTQQRTFTHPYKKHIDLLERTHGRIKGILTDERLQKVWRPLSIYVKTIEAMFTAPTIDDILNSMFNLNSVELDTVKKNLRGGSTYLSLTYIGTKESLWNKLRLLRVHCGLNRKEIARVFGNYVKWAGSYSLMSKDLMQKEILNKI